MSSRKITKSRKAPGVKSLDELSRHVAFELKKEEKKRNSLGIKVGDSVFVKGATAGEPSYVAEVVAFKGAAKEPLQVKLRWYYRPEDSHSGRQVWHGHRELFASNTYDWNPIACIEGKCFVHSIDAYDSLSSICPADFFSRFTYDPTQGRFKPDIIPVHCLCELPYNPDRDMVMCEACKDWFHWECVKFKGKKGAKDKKKRDNFYCSSRCKANRNKGNEA